MSNPRLKNYALTAGGTAALAATGLAGADIQTSSGPTPITAAAAGPGSFENLFSVAGVSVGASNQMRGSWSGTSGGSAMALLFTNGGSSPYMELAYSGSSIGPGWSGSSNLSRYMYFSSGSKLSSNGWLSLGTHLVGFAVAASGESYYGWIAYDLSISLSQDRYTFNVSGWAYNDVAGEGIIAGQNQAAGSSAVPGLGGLAALAIGAAGVRSRRQRTVA